MVADGTKLLAADPESQAPNGHAEPNSVAPSKAKVTIDFKTDQGAQSPPAQSPSAQTPLSRIARAFKGFHRKPMESHLVRAKTAEVQGQERSITARFWTLLVITAVLSATLSFGIDQFTFVVGIFRSKLTLGGHIETLSATALNVLMAVAARILVRTCAEAEGSGFPDMKAMLFGKVLFGKGMVDFLSMRVLVVKATALSLLVAAGLPVGKEGPNVHMAACIARNLDPGFFESKDDAHNMAGGGGGGTGGAVTKMLLACCAVGVGASFSAPIAGALFSLELMLPQSYDSSGYWGCFTAGVIGSIVYAMERSWTAGATGLLPLMSSNVLPGEGSASQWPFLRLLIDILLGSLCGLLGGLWVRSHTYTAGVLKRWRLRDPALLAAAGPALNAGLLGENKQSWVQKKLQAVLGTAQWRDLGAVAAVTALHTICASMLPLLGGKPQPLLISDLFNKTLLFPEQQAVWVVPSVGLLGTLFLCFLMKWTFTALALSLACPTGVVAPTMIIGGLIGRCFVLCLPHSLIDLLLSMDGGVVTEEMRGALMARFAIIGAAAFSSGVSRAFAMAISVFEVLALPNAVLPLCSATLASIYVANKVSLPFFDQNLVGRGWGGIPNITFSDRGSQPALSVMHHLDNATECLSQLTTLREILYVLGSSQNAFFPVVRPTGHESGAALLEGTMTRAHVEQLLRSKDPMGEKPDMKIDLLDPEFQAPPDGSEALVNGCPFRCGPETTIKDVYLLMKVAGGEHILYVTEKGCLQGVITFPTLITQQVA